MGEDQDDNQEREGVMILRRHVCMDFKELYFNCIVITFILLIP